jgi:hypothetical protein
MQLVGADWLRCNTREDDLSSRPGSIVQVFSFSFHFLLELERVLNIVKILLLEISYHMCFGFVFIQKYAAKGGPEFFFVIHIQVSMTLYLDYLLLLSTFKYWTVNLLTLFS